MSSPIISIIVPVYNVENYISECIESILTQTFAEFELLLINDGSLDKSGEICDSYARKDRRIHVFHKKNGGVSSARNLGLQNALGEWVTFVDADDWIANTFIENLYKPISSDKEIEFVQGGCTNYINNQIEDVEQRYENLINDDPIYVFNHFRGLTFSKLFNLQTIIRPNKLEFDEQMHTAEDFAFTLDYITHINKYSFVSEVGYYYRYNPKSLTHSKKVKPYNIALSEFKHLFTSSNKYIEKHQIPDTELVYRKKQNANILFNTCICLYLDRYKTSERKHHLMYDFSATEKSLLAYFNGSFINKLIIFFYRVDLIDLFDTLMIFRKIVGDIIRFNFKYQKS